MKNNQYSRKEVNSTMAQENRTRGEKPDYKGTIDVAAWFNTDADGNTYLSVVLGNRAKLLRNEDKQADKFN